MPKNPLMVILSLMKLRVLLDLELVYLVILSGLYVIYPPGCLNYIARKLKFLIFR